MYVRANGRIVAASLSASFFFAMAVLTLVVFAPAAQAEERTCRGTIGSRTVDNLRVPQGASCTLNGTKVEGTIKVERNATLVANTIRVKGNVQSEGFKNITLRQNSVVVGSVQLENGLDGGAGRVLNSRVNGDLQYFSNEARMIARGNTPLANFQATYGGTPFHLMMAASLVAMLPLVILFFALQRYFIQGVTMTGIKG